MKNLIIIIISHPIRRRRRLHLHHHHHFHLKKRSVAELSLPSWFKSQSEKHSLGGDVRIICYLPEEWMTLLLLHMAIMRAPTMPSPDSEDAGGGGSGFSVTCTTPG